MHDAHVDERPPDAIEPPYTAFSDSKQRMIVALVMVASLATPLVAIMYIPLLPSLAVRYNVSVQAISLTITAYLIAQAVAPLLLSTHSDTFGRRPIYLLSFALAAIASLGITLSGKSYPALLALRIVQSLGASAVLSVGYGIIADLKPPSTRGNVLGMVLAVGNCSMAIGPLIGGGIAYADGNVQWAFWTMLLACGLVVVLVGLLLPETARQVVGDGSVREVYWNRPIIVFLTDSGREAATGQQPRRKLTFRSPVQPFLLMRYADCALTLWIVGSYYAIWYTVQASIPLIFQGLPYEFNELQIGLCYLPGATGVVVAMFTTGKMMDHNYRVIERKQQQQQQQQQQQHPLEPVHTKSQSQEQTQSLPARAAHDITNFPIERARSRFTLPIIAVGLAFSCGYGWCIERNLHPAAPLIFQFFMGFLNISVMNVFSALLVDIFEDTPSSAATAGNLARCGFSAAAVAVTNPLTRVTSRGWFFTIMGLLSGGGSFVAVLLLNRYGMQWRQQRSKKAPGSVA